jgi:GxxExxY protein
MALLFERESYTLRGAFFEVYKDKGNGFLEDVYQECLEIELEERGVPFVAQPMLELSYKGRTLRQKYKPDFICYGSIVIEIKAVKVLEDAHRAQVVDYLKATKKRLGFLVNFSSHPQVTIERFVL